LVSQTVGSGVPGGLHRRADGEDQGRVVANRPVYLAIGIDCDGAKQVLGMWNGTSTGESSKFSDVGAV
jgi:hypothetical protein